jgi:penicillin V acylase-like amidase (Ntn superfamily)
MMLRCSVAAALVAAATSCSNFFMDSDPYKISVRTMDLGEGQFDLVVEPRSANNSLGFVSFVPAEAGVVLETFSTGGLNEAGLSCDLQTLTNSKFPAKQPGGVNVASEKFCAWVLSSHSTVNETRAALQTVTVYQGIAGNCHFAIRGASIARPSRSTPPPHRADTTAHRAVPGLDQTLRESLSWWSLWTVLCGCTLISTTTERPATAS